MRARALAGITASALAVVGVLVSVKATAITTSNDSPQTAVAAAPGDIKVLTYNVHGAKQDEETQAGLRWAARKQPVIDRIKVHDPDIFGVQEASKNAAGTKDSATDLIAAFSSTHDSFPATNPKPGGPKTIFYDKARFEQVSDADGPRRGQVVVYEGAKPCWTTRYMTWIVLRDVDTAQKIFVGNTHFPAGSKCSDAKLAAAKKVRKTIADKNPNNLPTIMMGDFNNKPAPCFNNPEDSDAAPLKWLLEKNKNGLLLQPDVRLDQCLPTSNPQWPGTGMSGARIDHILTNRKFTVVTRTVDRRLSTITSTNGQITTVSPASDHYPVVVTLRRS